MPVFERLVTFPVQVSAPNAAIADRDVRDLVDAAAEHVESRDTAGTLTVGKPAVTAAAAPACGAKWIVVYGQGDGATQRVGEWLAGGAVDSRLVRGLWTHRPAVRDEQAGGA